MKLAIQFLATVGTLLERQRVLSAKAAVPANTSEGDLGRA